MKKVMAFSIPTVAVSDQFKRGNMIKDISDLVPSLSTKDITEVYDLVMEKYHNTPTSTSMTPESIEAVLKEPHEVAKQKYDSMNGSQQNIFRVYVKKARGEMYLNSFLDQ
jgi:hypothetical protein